ncbi:MAG TPA: DUF1015 family protein [Candidatus Methanoperedens sp.]
MVDIRPFRATVLNPKLQIDKLVCPVYDTIDAANFEKFAKEKNNIIHATVRRKDMGRDEFIEYASCELDRLINSEILVEREKPSFYIYGIMYTLKPEVLAQIPEKDRRSQYFVFGLVSLVKVEELGKGSILGHENIFEVNTNERYRLMKAAMMNFSPITAEYSMPGHGLNNLFEEFLGFKRPDLVLDPRKPPIVDVLLDGSRHLLWEISDNNMINKITHMMLYQKILILDGHHRYAASYQMREKDGIEYTLMMLMERDDRALFLLPWHRAVRNFDIVRLDRIIKEKFLLDFKSPTNGEEFYSRLRERKNDHDVKLGVYDGKMFSVIRADEKAVQALSKERGEKVGIDLIVLHYWLINQIVLGRPEEDVSFNSSPDEAIARVDSREFDIAFILNPFSIRDVERKAFDERRNFPQKSTLFLPKVAEGIVMRKI